MIHPMAIPIDSYGATAMIFSAVSNLDAVDWVNTVVVWVALIALTVFRIAATRFVVTKTRQLRGEGHPRQVTAAMSATSNAPELSDGLAGAARKPARPAHAGVWKPAGQATCGERSSINVDERFGVLAEHQAADCDVHSDACPRARRGCDGDRQRNQRLLPGLQPHRRTRTARETFGQDHAQGRECSDRERITHGRGQHKLLVCGNLGAVRGEPGEHAVGAEVELVERQQRLVHLHQIHAGVEPR